MSDKQKFLKVAIDVPLNKLFDYLPNEESFSIGQYVTIPFGRRKMIGVICEISLNSDIHPSKLKSVINVDPEIIFDVQMFKLLTFVSKYYHYPIGQTIMSVVPGRLKKNLNQLRKFELIYQATPKLTNDFIYYYEKGFRANKIGIPSGVFSGNTLLDRVEAFYKKDMSKTLSIEAITAISKFFKGISFHGNSSPKGTSLKDYIEFLETTKNGTSLGQLIIDQFELSRTALNGLNDDFTIQLENNKLDMLITYDIIQVAVVLLKVDMLQALNINVDYIDADGD